MGFPLLGDPAAMQALAATLDRRAEDLVAVGHRVRQRADTATWQCARADRFRSEMHYREQQAGQQAAHLHDIASRLRRVAGQVQAEINLVTSIEKRVRSLFSSFNPTGGLTPPWSGTRWNPTNLPRTGDPAWLKVAQALGVRVR